MKIYPLDPHSVGEDCYIVMSKGHHEAHEFMRAVRRNGYDWQLGWPTQDWYRAVPCNVEGGCKYVEAAPGSRGAFPVTVAVEAYGEDVYMKPAQNNEQKLGGEQS